MRTLYYQIHYGSAAQRYNLYHLTDLHVGAKACDEALLTKHVKQIAADENAMWIGGGDYIDAICHVGDKRYKPETLAPWALGYTDVMGVQRDYVLDMLSPIADKCIGLGSGNHEWIADGRYGRGLYWEIVTAMAQRKGVSPEQLGFGVQGFIVLSFLQKTAKSAGHGWKMVIFSHHGYGQGRLAGGHALTLQRILNDYDCDLALLGHRHVFCALTKITTSPGRETARTRQAWAVFVPGYLDTFVEPNERGQVVDTYPELLALPPQPRGTFPIEINPYERRFTLLMQSGTLGR